MPKPSGSQELGDQNRLVKIAFRLAGSLLLVMSFLLLSAAVGLAKAPEESDHPPNIVLIMADDLGYGQLGCYGQQKIRTPRIDELALEGMRFSQAYAGSIVCQPSRCVLMTGLHTGHTAVRANDVNQWLGEDDLTIAKVLKQAGYATGVFGKWGIGPENTPGHPNRQGFDEFFGQLLQVHAHFYYPSWVWKNETRYPLPGNKNGMRQQYVDDEIHAKAMEFIREQHEGPFFAYVPYIAPHVELVVPEDSEVPYREQFPRQTIVDPREGYIGSEDGFTTFAGMVSRLDDHVGEILDLLDELGIADNTLVIFTSDNGPQNGGQDEGWTKMTDFFAGENPLRGYKGQMYERGIRVPLVVRWPGHVPVNTQSDHIATFWDMMPTLAEVAGEQPPAEIDGLSFLPTLLGEIESQETHEAIYWEYPHPQGGIKRALRQGPWKGVQLGPDAGIELYNLDEDRVEKHNIAAYHPKIIERLSQWMDAAHRPAPTRPDKIKRPRIADFVSSVPGDGRKRSTDTSAHEDLSRLHRGAVLLDETFENLDAWHFEGLVDGVSRPEAGVLRLDCSDSRQGGVGCMAFCRKDFPDNILLEYDLFVEEKRGLVLTFIAMKGTGGEDAITGVPPRQGIFADYVGEEASTRSYHVSISRYNDKGVHSGVSNWRRNPGLNLMGQGPDLCQKTKTTYRIAIAKRGGFLQLFVNGQLASEFTDPGELEGPVPHTGKIGFRLIGDKAVARFSNIRITEIK